MSAADDLRAAQQSLRQATERLRRHADGRRATLPPSAEPFSSCTRILASVPVRQFPICASCGEHIRRGGVFDQNDWHHDVCWAEQITKGESL